MTSVDGLDVLDELINAEAVLACVVHEVMCLLDDLSAFGDSDDGDAASAAEFEQAFAGFTGFDEPKVQPGCVEIKPGVPVLCIHPVLPHGSWVLWGG